MDKFEILFPVGEGTYGKVLKAINKNTHRTVAIKKIKNIDDFIEIKKIALREIRILKTLKHPNIVSLLEVLQERNRIYLIFEYVDSTIYQLIERHPIGIDVDAIRKILFQLLMALNYCHTQNIVHRDIKPENLLMSASGCLKLCDFGFARYIQNTENMTQYVSTRWYRAPELLVYADYGLSIDIWATGCLIAELLTGQPLFPGNNDYETLCLIVRLCGKLPKFLSNAFLANQLYKNFQVMINKVPKAQTQSLEQRFGNFNEDIVEIMRVCLEINPGKRPTCESLLNHKFFEPINSKINSYKSKSTSRNIQNINLNILTVTPSSQISSRKLSPNNNWPVYKDIPVKLKKIPESFFIKAKDRLPKIKLRKVGIKEVSSFANMYIPGRIGTKSTLKSRIIDGDPGFRNYSLFDNGSNEDLSNQIGGQMLTHRSRKVIKRNLADENVSLQSIKRRYSKLGKLDLSKIHKSKNLSNIAYSTPRK